MDLEGRLRGRRWENWVGIMVGVPGMLGTIVPKY